MSRLCPLLLAALAGCSEYDLGVTSGELGIPLECGLEDVFPDTVVPVESCAQVPGSFTPIVEWGAGEGMVCQSSVAVADLDGDGLPEILANFSTALVGSLYVLNGDGTVKWTVDASLGYAAGLAVGDVDRDGHPDIFGVKAVGLQLPGFGDPDYSVVRYDWEGHLVWESGSYKAADFDYATGLILSDMDHDGSVEIVAGRVILREDGSERGVGTLGRGSMGDPPPMIDITEATIPAVSDIDLDGVEEVITGNAVYSPDGDLLWSDESQEDGMVAIADLDGDPYGERIVVSHKTVRAVDDDGTIIWGPMTIEGANIVSTPAIADVNGDDVPEIFIAGGDQLLAIRADGVVYWSVPVTDQSGASGPTVFDFEGDGNPDVVYLDEENMSVYDGRTGALKFFSTEHASTTMYDYPVVADVDADGEAEIVVAHSGFGRALSVYGDRDHSWAPARRVWNQHAYSITNVNDDLTIPTTVEPSFTTHNTWHSAIDTRYLNDTLKELTAEIVDTCEVECSQGNVYVVGRVVNHAAAEVAEPIPVALYAVTAGAPRLIGQTQTAGVTPAASSGMPFAFTVSASQLVGVDTLRMVVDDDGSGLGVHFECDETNNAAEISGPFCP